MIRKNLTRLFVSLLAVVTFCGATSVGISLSNVMPQVEIPEELEPLKEIIIEKLVTPEDGNLEREIKSLFAQYILLAAMDAATNSTNSSSTSDNVSHSPMINEEPLFPVRAEVSSSPTYQQQANNQPQQQPQVIYVYVTPPTEAPRTEPSNVRTKKTKPPKTKKPRPGHHDHDNNNNRQQSQQQEQQQQPQQLQPQPIYIQVPQQQQPQNNPQQPQVIYVQPPTPQPTPNYLQLQLQQLLLQQQQLQAQIDAQQTTPASVQQQQQSQPPTPAPTSGPTVQATQPPPQTIVVVQQPPPTQAPAVEVPTTSVPILTPPPQQGTGGSAAAAVTLPPAITPRPTPSQEHVLNQVDLILQNVAKGNITGIVDQSLAIRAPMPVRNLVNGILNTVFCNPINRLLGRCRGRSDNDQETFLITQ